MKFLHWIGASRLIQRWHSMPCGGLWPERVHRYHHSIKHMISIRSIHCVKKANTPPIHLRACVRTQSLISPLWYLNLIFEPDKIIFHNATWLGVFCIIFRAYACTFDSHLCQRAVFTSLSTSHPRYCETRCAKKNIPYHNNIKKKYESIRENRCHHLLVRL